MCGCIETVIKYTVHAHEYNPRGGHSVHTHTEGSVRENSRQPKNISLASLNPKISAPFILRHLKTNMKYLEAMQIDVTNASNKPRNISLAIFDAEKH